MNIISSVCLFLCARLCVCGDGLSRYLSDMEPLWIFLFYNLLFLFRSVCGCQTRVQKSETTSTVSGFVTKTWKKAESLRIQGINKRRRSEVVWIVPQFKFFTSEKRDRMYPKHDPAEPKRQHHQKINMLQRFRLAKKYLNFTVDDWKWVLFTDKVKFEKEYQDFRRDNDTAVF